MRKQELIVRSQSSFTRFLIKKCSSERMVSNLHVEMVIAQASLGTSHIYRLVGRGEWEDVWWVTWFLRVTQRRNHSSLTE